MLQFHLLAHLAHQLTALLVQQKTREAAQLDSILVMLHCWQHIIDECQSAKFILPASTLHRGYFGRFLLDWHKVWSLLVILFPSLEGLVEPLICVCEAQETKWDPLPDGLNHAFSLAHATLDTLTLSVWQLNHLLQVVALFAAYLVLILLLRYWVIIWVEIGYVCLLRGVICSSLEKILVHICLFWKLNSQIVLVLLICINNCRVNAVLVTACWR